jgi:cysteine synthase A
MTVRVLVVDDSPFFRRQLCSSLAQNPGIEVVGTAEDGRQAVEKTLALRPDLITMDYAMPVMDGIHAVRKIMKALGAKLVLTDPKLGMKGAIQKAQELAESDPDRFLLLQQFQNPANPAIHESTTGPEIWRDTDGGIDVLVAGVGTGGTITGVSRYIKHTQGKAITSVAVEPTDSSVIKNAMAGAAPSHKPHKIQGIGAGFVPDNLDLSLIDQVEQVTNEESIEFAHRLMREEGILAGISCGAAAAVAARLAAQEAYQDKTIVVILPDSAERYLSTALFEGVFTEQELTQ